MCEFDMSKCECTMICELCGKDSDVETVNTRLVEAAIMNKTCWIVCDECANDFEDKILHIWNN